MKYGYIRVSSRDQNEARQIKALTDYGIEPPNLFVDHWSGADFNRPAYRKLMRKIRRGDTLVIQSIDRLGRNYAEMLDQWRILTKRKGVGIVVLDMPLLNTANTRDLTQTLIADIVLQLLSYVAETERTFIRKRQAEGIAAAKSRGVKFGRPSLPVPVEARSVIADWRQGVLSARQAAKTLGVSRTTLSNWAKEISAALD